MTIVEYFLKEYENFRARVPKGMNKQDWEESLQETYISLLNVDYDVSYKKTFINTSAIRKNYNTIVTRNTRKGIIENLKTYADTTKEAKTPEQLIIDNEEIMEIDARIYNMLEFLPEEQKVAIKDVLLELTFEDIGKKRNWKPNTAKKRYYSGIRKLKQKAGVTW